MDANYAYYALHKLHIRPRDYLLMDPREKAFVFAAIDERLRAEREAERKARVK